MPSTYSPDLRIELIGPGEQAGTWNTTTNTNLGTLIEDAISGYVSVSVTSANQALSASNGAGIKREMQRLPCPPPQALTSPSTRPRRPSNTSSITRRRSLPRSTTPRCLAIQRLRALERPSLRVPKSPYLAMGLTSG